MAKTSILAVIAVLVLTCSASAANETATGSYAPGYGPANGTSAAAPTPPGNAISGLSIGYGSSQPAISTGGEPSLLNQVLLSTSNTPVYLPSGETLATVSNNGIVTLILNDQRSHDDDDHDHRATPEPASASMVALAMASLVFLARRAKPTR